MQITWECSADKGIREVKILAENAEEEKRLFEARERIVEIVGPSTTPSNPEETLPGESGRPAVQAALAASEDLLRTGGC